MPNILILILALGAAPILPLVATFYFWWVRYKHRKLEVKSGLTGKDVAARILAENQLSDVTIGTANDVMGDHYDPKKRMIRLSPSAHDGKSAFAMAVAAHECGHALQQKEGYRYFNWWMAVAPYAHIGTFILQMLFLLLAGVWKPAIFLLVILFATVFLMSLLALPMEYDASRRALREIDRLGLASSPEERSALRTVLIAAGLTYVAKSIQDLCLAIYYVLRARARS